MRNKILFGALALFILSVGFVQPADAALFVSISDSLSTKTCDNGTAGGVTTCTANGFTTALNANFINFTGTFGGYTFSGASGVTGNVPGTSTLGTVSDSKLTVTHDVASSDLTVDFGGYNFTLPSGPNLLLSASATANWTNSVATDQSTFQAWGKNDNSTGVPGGTSTAIVPVLTTPGGLTTADAKVSPDVAFARSAVLNCFAATVNCYSMTGREVIHQAIGTIASYQATETVLNVPTNAVPEPASMLLLGAGLVGLAAGSRRRLLKR